MRTLPEERRANRRDGRSRALQVPESQGRVHGRVEDSHRRLEWKNERQVSTTHDGGRHGRVEEGVGQARTGLAPTASGHAARDLQGEMPHTRGIPCDNANAPNATSGKEVVRKIKERLQQRIGGEHEKAKQAKQHSHKVYEEGPMATFQQHSGSHQGRQCLPCTGQKWPCLARHQTRNHR